MTVFLIAALTADGFIAQETSQVSTAWTSKEDKTWFNDRTKQAGAIVMGSKTFDTIGRALPGRLNVVMTRDPDKYRQQYPEAGDNLYFTNQSPSEVLENLKIKNYSEVAICGGSSIYTQFAKAGLLDKIYLTHEPVIFGKGVGLFSEEVTLALKLVKLHTLSEQTVVFEYEVLKTV
jgi:dihydrofolate reductase